MNSDKGTYPCNFHQFKLRNVSLTPKHLHLHALPSWDSPPHIANHCMLALPVLELHVPSCWTNHFLFGIFGISICLCVYMCLFLLYKSVV